MRLPTRRRLAIPAALGAVAIALMAFAAPVFAKESVDAQLDAPIARDTPGGTTLLLGVWVTMTDETGTHDVDGSPVYVRMTGPDGVSTTAIASQGRAGHYTVRVEVPASGVRAVEIGIRGTTDLPFNLVGFTIVPGPISAETAQAASQIAAVSPPAPRPTVPAPRAVPAIVPAADPGTTITPVAAPVDSFPVPLIVGAVALLAAALAILALVRITAHARVSAGAREA